MIASSLHRRVTVSTSAQNKKKIWWTQPYRYRRNVPSAARTTVVALIVSRRGGNCGSIRSGGLGIQVTKAVLGASARICNIHGRRHFAPNARAALKRRKTQTLPFVAREASDVSCLAPLHFPQCACNVGRLLLERTQHMAVVIVCCSIVTIASTSSFWFQPSSRLVQRCAAEAPGG